VIDVFDEGVDAKLEEDEIQDPIKEPSKEVDSKTSDDDAELDKSESK